MIGLMWLNLINKHFVGAEGEKKKTNLGMLNETH